MKMKLGNWKTMFAPQILRRGEDYFYQGAVDSLDFDGTILKATVSGTEDYTVEIAVAGGAVAEMFCDCPYAEDAYCKHMAAVLFAASADDFPGEEQARKDEERLSLKDAVEALSVPDVRELLWKFARKYPDIGEQVMLKAAGRVTDAQVQEWMRQIVRLGDKHSERDGYISYRAARAYIRDMKALLNEKIDILLECGMPLKAFELTCKALSEASGADIDDSEGGVGGLWWTCAEHWKKLLSRMTPEEKNKVFDWIQANYRRWVVSDDILDNFLFWDSKPDAAFQEPEFLRRKLELLDAQISKPGEDSYALESCISYRLDIMKKLPMTAEEIERYAWEHYRVRGVRQRLLNEALEENRLDDAVKILQDSKKIDAKFSHYVDEYSEKLTELYRTLNRTDDLRTELLFQLENQRQSDLQHVKALKDITPPEQWPELRERLLTMKTLSWVKGEILEMDGLYQRLFDYATSGGSLDFMDKFIDTLGKRYPMEIRRFYVDCLREDMKNATNQKRYAELVRRLKPLSGLRGGAEAAASLAQEWRTAYPKRRTMLEELKKAGF